MRGLSGAAGTLAAAAWLGFGAWAAVAQEPVVSDRAGKERRVDFDPTEPAPAPGARRLADQPDAVPVPAPGPGVVTGRARTGRAVRAAAESPVVASHQIDRYDAIKKVQTRVQKYPNSVADWVILGELAHEVAVDAPADQAGPYFQMSRGAFEKALALDPKNDGLKAAVRFARDQQAHLADFESSRDTATDVFLDARRRDLAATSNTPYLKVYAPPLPSRTLPGPAPASSPVAAAEREAEPASAGAAARANATDPLINASTPLNAGPATPVAEAATALTPAREGAPSTDAANYGTQANYSAPRRDWVVNRYGGPVYVPYDTPDGPPYTYQQYNNSYFPPGLYNNPTAQPMTLQRYLPTGLVPAAVPNALERNILNRATATPLPRR